MDCSSLQNAGLAALTASLPQLRRLSLIKIPWLTNSCVGGALMRLGVLTCLQLHDNSNITCAPHPPTHTPPPRPTPPYP